MRIVAGQFRGHRLKAPRGADTRPTSDKVRESLFSTLSSLGMLDAAEVLDVFAGSGALGLEALSRGASRAVFVERAHQALHVLKDNIAALGVADRTQVLANPAKKALAATGPLTGSQFDLIVADPPYPMTTAEVGEVLVLAQEFLRDESSLLVLERSTRSEPPRLPAGLRFYEQRTYGETAVWLMELDR